MREQYLMNEDGFEELLLSPRSTRKQMRDGDESTTFTCCSTCSHNLSNNKVYKPPQFGITNGFLIGYVPKEVVDEIDDVLAASIARLRIFTYVFSYRPGVHKSIVGHHTLFMNQPEQIQRALEYTSRKIGNPNIYTMISGRLTPKQHDIAKRRCTINSAEYTKLLHFLQQNHLSYSKVEMEETNPQPVNICGL